jgi:class 3 adenylate cyclase
MLGGGLRGGIVRGLAERIDAVVWFSDLRGFTRNTDTAPEQVIPLRNDYFDAIVSAFDKHGGDVVKLIGDGTLTVLTAEDRIHACQYGVVRRDRRAAKCCQIEEAPGGGRQAGNRYIYI